MNKIAFTSILLAILAAGCQAAEAEPVATLTANPLPTAPLLPTITPTVTNTPEPTATPTPEEVEKPPYSECGDPSLVSHWGTGHEVIGADGAPIPTGLVGDKDTIGRLVTTTARACLTEIEGFTDPIFPDDAIRAKVVFYDTDGNSHEYTIMLGALKDDGGQKKVGLCNGGSCRVSSVSETLEALENFVADPNVSKQVDVQFVTYDNGAPWSLTPTINQYADFLIQLNEA